MLKKLIVCIAVVSWSPLAQAELVADDFDSGHTLGAIPVGWSTKFETNVVPPQVSLVTVETGVGRDGSQGLSVDVTKALQLYRMNHLEGIDDTRILLGADIKFAISGVELTNTPSGVNLPFIGCYISTEPDFFAGEHFTMSIIRRDAGDTWGLMVPAPDFVFGNLPNSELGVDVGTVASTSIWFRMTMELTDDVTNWLAVASVYDTNETLILQSPSYLLPTSFVSGATLYGGFNTGFNGTNTPIDGVSKITELSMDNFLFGGPTVQLTGLANEDVTGHSFTSVAGKTHRLQYSMDEINYKDTGASVAGDGTGKVLVDPAIDTAGRIYRVTSD